MKFFCKLDFVVDIKFKFFVFGLFFDMIDIPGFYNEVDTITYHSKLAIIIQKFLEKFFQQNQEKVFS